MLITFVLSSTVYSFVLDEKLLDENMEKRAIRLFKVIKCPICTGEVLFESQSEVAYNMRNIIRNMIKYGNTDEEIILKLKNFYGNQVVNTTFSQKSLLFVLVVCFVIGLAAVYIYIR